MADGHVVVPGDQILDTRLQAHHRLAEAFLAMVGPGELLGSGLIAPPRPGRLRPREPQRADEEEERQEHAEEPGPYLALEQGDRREGKEQDEAHEQGHQCLDAAGHGQVAAHVLDTHWAHAQQQQRGHTRRDEHSVDRNPARAGPVHVPQMQDERELVENERGAQAEERSGGRSPVLGVQGGGDPGHARDDHEDDPEHHVVQVHVARGNVARPPADLGPDHPH
jgi:hypothetical protein